MASSVMGAQNSNLRKSIEDDFRSRMDDTGRDWLSLDELLALRVNCYPRTARCLCSATLHWAWH